jgi:predicted SnoaL-like aldol condensation-catalyzing enzyme
MLDTSSTSRFVESVWNGGRLDVVDEIIAADYLGHDRTRAEVAEGRDGVRRLVAAWRDAFPDLEVRIEDQVREGDRVALRWTASGTAVAAHGVVSVEWSGISVFRVLAGKHVESWTHWDGGAGEGLPWAA